MELMAVVAIALLCGWGGWVAVRMVTKRGAEAYRRAAAKLERVAGMSIGEASARAATWLADGRVFECREAPGDEAALVMLPEETIYVLYPDEPTDATFGTYGSVCHWIVAVASQAGSAPATFSSAAEPDANSE